MSWFILRTRSPTEAWWSGAISIHLRLRHRLLELTRINAKLTQDAQTEIAGGTRKVVVAARQGLRPRYKGCEQADRTMLIHRMSTQDCTKVLAANRLARLACAKDGRPYVVPIYFAYSDNHLYAFSMPGKKIEWMRSNPLVSVQLDERGQGRAWRSVVVDGRYEELPDRIGHKHERDHAWSLLSKHPNWWEPGALKPAIPPVSDHSMHVFFRIVIEQLSGREAME